MKRVVITGMGVTTPLGNDLNLFCSSLLASKSGITTLSRFDTTNLDTTIGGQCELGRFAYKDIKIDFAIHAADQAMSDASVGASVVFDHHRKSQTGLSLGIGLELFDMNNLVSLRNNSYKIPTSQKENMSFLQTPGDLCGSILISNYDLSSPPQIHVSACAASTDAIGNAFLEILRGRKTMMLAGGTDSMINPLGLAGFCKLQALSTNNKNPELASKPFDLLRDGFVLGEGAGILVLEEYEHAIRRGAKIHAEIVGYGNGFDAFSVSDPHPAGRGAVSAMRRALKFARIAPDQISYINAHGTSTLKNDVMETRAIKTVFGKQAYQIPVSSTKSMIGHLISSSGAVESIAAIACAKKSKVHPTLNYTKADPDCDLDYVPNTSRDHHVGYILKNSFAFGGQNASLIFRLH